jgi:hypothetical protein
MKTLEKRIRDLEELLFRVVLQVKAENMAIRDIFLENNLIPPKRWDELVKEHKRSYSSFTVIKEMEARSNTESVTRHGNTETESRRDKRTSRPSSES